MNEVNTLIPTADAHVAKKAADGTVVVADPFDATTYYAASEVGELIKAVRERADGYVRAMKSLGPLEEAPIDAVRDLRKACEQDDKALKDYEGHLKDGLLECSGFKAYVVQTKGAGARIDPLAVRGVLRSIASECKAVEATRKTPAMLHTHLIMVTCEDRAWAKIDNAIAKERPESGTSVLLSRTSDIKAAGELIARADAANKAAAKAAHEAALG